jgi:hypothetical protein
LIVNSQLLAAQPQHAAGVLVVVWVVLGVASMFWVWMMADALQHEPSTTEKLSWAVVIGCMNVVGALIYFLTRRHVRRAHESMATHAG